MMINVSSIPILSELTMLPFISLALGNMFFLSSRSVGWPERMWKRKGQWNPFQIIKYLFSWQTGSFSLCTFKRRKPEIGSFRTAHGDSFASKIFCLFMTLENKSIESYLIGFFMFFFSWFTFSLFPNTLLVTHYFIVFISFKPCQFLCRIK